MKLKGIVCAILFCSVFLLPAQSLSETESKMAMLFGTLKKTYEQEECIKISKQIENELYKALKNPESFNYPFSSLNHLGKIYSEDNLLRIYSWNVPFNDGTYTYGCIIQQKNNNMLTVLKTAMPAYKPDENKEINGNSWYGALYYKAIAVKRKKEVYYTLLGWSGNDLTNVKMIDALRFDPQGNAKLGLPVFKKKDKLMHRVIFEYTNQANMTLDYDKKSKQIIFDHLSPSAPKYEGIYTHYGPDFTYDSFLLKKREWLFKEDIDVRNTLY